MEEQPKAVRPDVTRDKYGPVYTFDCPQCTYRRHERTKGPHRCRCGLVVTLDVSAGPEAKA